MATQSLLIAAGSLFGGCFAATVLLVPLVRRFARRVGAVDQGGYRKVFEGAMPLLGGLAIALPLVTLGIFCAIGGYLVFLNWGYLLRHYPAHFDAIYGLATYSRRECFVLAAGALGILALGLVDDTRGMRARYKLAGQLAVALFVTCFGFAVSSVSLPLLGTINLGLPLGILLTAFWIVGLINAFNLIDGIDGLASGIAFVGALSLVALSLIQGNAFITLAGAALAGGVLAFLLFNFPPARMFLGDTGSMFLGYALATMSLVGAQKSPAAIILVAPVLALSFPIFETLVSIIRRYLRGVPIFMGDNHHTHHRLLSKGYSQPRVVLTLCGVAVCLAASAVLAALAREGSPAQFLSYALFCGSLAYIAWLAGYLRPTTFRRIADRRRRNRLLHAFSAYATLCLNGNGSTARTGLLLALCRQELGLHHLDLRLASGAVLLASPTHDNGTPAATPTERLRVKSADGQDLFIHFDFIEIPDEHRRNDANACLAAIFDQIRLDRLPNSPALPAATPDPVPPVMKDSDIPV
ncbi:MAG: undecaprenyl/decaprenyl-phosphate alpha-N-acetylglucosaminyl 1-phosphate transferase [Candidatus Hydrogenedentes bacterium]|nr:undecaprenyl/decaprenyl-phosphate alpha-N-acetylglucosaminyl 1-phosphate transferase [Candidatus Hydrogenedentota bacterium]